MYRNYNVQHDFLSSQTFFKPAVENIRNNLGENSVTEDNIRIVCRQILEDAKVQYYSGSQSRGSSPYSDSETGSVGRDYRFGQTVSRVRTKELLRVRHSSASANVAFIQYT